MTKAERDSRREQMIAMREDGMTYREIGEHYGIAPQTVSCAINRPMSGIFAMKEPKHQPAPEISKHEILEIADKVKKETGKYPSYGKVVQGIENGSIDPWRYIRRKRRVI